MRINTYCLEAGGLKIAGQNPGYAAKAQPAATKREDPDTPFRRGNLLNCNALRQTVQHAAVTVDSLSARYYGARPSPLGQWDSSDLYAIVNYQEQFSNAAFRQR
jgi:hypothetical protein